MRYAGASLATCPKVCQGTIIIGDARNCLDCDSWFTVTQKLKRRRQGWGWGGTNMNAIGTCHTRTGSNSQFSAAHNSAIRALGRVLTIP